MLLLFSYLDAIKKISKWKTRQSGTARTPEAHAGATRFDLFRKHLGIAPTMLIKRLAALTKDGFLENRTCSERPPREEYILAASGRDFLPVLLIAALARQNCSGAFIQYIDDETGLEIRPVGIDARFARTTQQPSQQPSHQGRHSHGPRKRRQQMRIPSGNRDGTGSAFTRWRADAANQIAMPAPTRKALKAGFGPGGHVGEYFGCVATLSCVPMRRDGPLDPASGHSVRFAGPSDSSNTSAICGTSKGSCHA